MKTVTFSSWLGILLGFFATYGCIQKVEKEPILDSEVKHIADPNRDKNDPVWVYSGLLPKLQDVRVKVSVRGHTVRVIGFLPASFTGTLPEHAIEETISGRRRVMVVYPIATVDSNFIKEDGEQASNAAVGEYRNVGVYPYNPYGVGGEKNKNTPWGGFPYIEYERGRNIAFHGPITRFGGLWRLIRGPVSHACNRMQGEHVVEFASMLGVPMNRSWTMDDMVPVNAVVEVLPYNEFDKVADGKLAGKLVDVDYTPDISNISAMKVDPQNSYMFKTWSGVNHPDWICVLESARLGQSSPCSKVALNSPPAPEPTPEPTPAPTPKPKPKPTPKPNKPVIVKNPTHQPNAQVCNFDPATNFVRIWNTSFSQIIGNAVLGGKLEILGDGITVNPSNGARYRKVWIFGDPKERSFSGQGYIAAIFVCPT
jgi:hypothetical protein